MSITVIKSFDQGADELYRQCVEKLMLAVNTGVKLVESHFKENLFVQGSTGCIGHFGTINHRSGALRNSIRTLPAEEHFGTIQGRMTIGTPYAGVHFGPQGQSMTITPKGTQYLAIPLPAAQGNYGEAKGSPRDPIFGKTFVQKSKAGNLIIFGLAVAIKNKEAKEGARMHKLFTTGRARLNKQDIVPLFALKSSVTVQTHVDPDQELKKMQPQFDATVKDVFNG